MNLVSLDLVAPQSLTVMHPLKELHTFAQNALNQFVITSARKGCQRFRTLLGTAADPLATVGLLVPRSSPLSTP